MPPRGRTRLSAEGLATVLDQPPSVVEETSRRERNVDSEIVDNLDDPVEQILWMLLLQDPEVTVDAHTNTVSGVKNEHIIKLHIDAAAANDNMKLIPHLEYTT